MLFTKKLMFKLMPKMSKKGFTLVEVLLAITVGAVLVGSSLAVLNSQGVAAKGRDGVRKADLKKIQTALEFYYSQNRTYPASPAGSWAVVSIETVKVKLVPIYIDEIPLDPNPAPGGGPCVKGARNYFYKTNASNTAYYLVGIMEVESSASDSMCETVVDDFDCAPPTCYLLKSSVGKVNP